MDRVALTLFFRPPTNFLPQMCSNTLHVKMNPIADLRRKNRAQVRCCYYITVQETMLLYFHKFNGKNSKTELFRKFVGS